MQAKILISGSVQGVGFRYFVKGMAKNLGLTGWVRNTEEGNVEAIFQGIKENIEKMVTLCREGPPMAEVKNVEVSWEESGKKFDAFEII